MIIKQIRYYGEGSELNTDNELIANTNILTENIICDEIRIMAYPGTQMIINNADVNIGINGRYEILYKEKCKIYSIEIKENSLNFIKTNPDAFLIITFIKNYATDNNLNSTEDNTNQNDTSSTVIFDNHEN